MAIDFSRFNIFKRLDARGRVFFLLAAIVGILFLIYIVTRFFTGGETTGTTRVAAPPNIQNVPGADLNAEYQRTLEQANVQSAQQAQMSGTSAVSTAIPTALGSCVVCSDQAANVKSDLDTLSSQGKITPEVAAALQALASKNVAVCEFAAELDDAVRQSKLAPEQARDLLATYKKQHANALLAESAKLMDSFAKNGQLSVDAANTLLTEQKNNVSSSDYAVKLQELLLQAKLIPTTVRQLLAQYTQQRAREIILQSICQLNQMSRNGQIVPNVLKDLIELETRMVPIDTFDTALKKYVSAGTLTPAVSRIILDEYNQQKLAIGPTGTINDLIAKAEADAYNEINDLLKAGRITQDVANMLVSMIKQNVTFVQFQAAVNQLVAQKKLTPEIAKLKLGDYKKIKDLRDLAQRLAALQANSASPSAYADELKRAVQAGIITPEEAAQLMQQYQALASPVLGAPLTGAPGTEEFAKLAQRVQAGAAAPVTTTTEFTAAQVQGVGESLADRQARIEALMNAMSGQAQQLIASWQPPNMVHRGSSEVAATTKTVQKTVVAGGGPGGPGGPPGAIVGGPPLVKAGTIYFAVLDTAVNSDYPDSPVLATVVLGPLKGAKLLGKMALTKGVAGQQDRLALNFTIMNRDDWLTTKNINAYAIDPDTARSVMASSVNYHYLKRFGAIMATSFLQGFATSITNAGTSTTGIFGTSTTHPTLGTSSKIWVGLGQVGQTLGEATQNWINIPPTVKVDSGVSLGILFMSDVT